MKKYIFFFLLLVAIQCSGKEKNLKESRDSLQLKTSQNIENFTMKKPEVGILENGEIGAKLLSFLGSKNIFLDLQQKIQKDFFKQFPTTPTSCFAFSALIKTGAENCENIKLTLFFQNKERENISAGSLLMSTNKKNNSLIISIPEFLTEISGIKIQIEGEMTSASFVEIIIELLFFPVKND